jgi:RNA polymerase sigma-70 factor, ECF subfamily
MTDLHQTIEAVWKIESTRLIAAIARVTRDIGIAEELAQDALVTGRHDLDAALEGIPAVVPTRFSAARTRCFHARTRARFVA